MAAPVPGAAARRGRPAGGRAANRAMEARGAQRDERRFEEELAQLVEALRGPKRARFSAVFDYAMSSTVDGAGDQFPRGVRTLGTENSC